MNNTRNIFKAILYFLIATIITWWFVDASPLYTSVEQKIMSTGIAGAKWGLQIAAAFIFLRNKKWEFVKDLGATSLAGSTVLLPYAIAATVSDNNSGLFFVNSLLLAVVLMIGLYFLHIRRSGLPLRWFGGWLICLGVAITLQLTVVFSVIKL
jgi:hypothetical protein